jgi:phage shock protein C
MEKRLCRSTINKKIWGVCGGLGEYFNIDPTIIRLCWLMLVLAFGTGVLLYIIAAIIMPNESTT